MSVTITVICERCNATITSERTVFDVRSGPMLISTPLSPETSRPALDLCARCIEDFKAWLEVAPAAD